MRCVVQKYGGSSVADLDKIRAVAARIARVYDTGLAVVAVVSAMGNTTNELIELAHQLSDRPARREFDMLVSVGERISVALLAMALEELGVPARSFTGSQSGIITDEAHADASVVAVQPDRLRQCLASGRVAVVAGFQGVSREREVTTLGRGGSDTTAVVLAAALQAEYCEICSDVDGVWSADPRVVDDAARLDALPLNAALSAARGGAKVLFEDAVRFARDRQIEIRARSTFGPGAGTRLTVDVSERPQWLVTGDQQLRRLTGLTADDVGVVRAQGGRLRRRVGAVWFVDMRNVHGELLLTSGVDEGPTAMLTVAGSSAGEDGATGARIQDRLGDHGIATCLSGAEADAMWWEVEPAQLDMAVRVAHAVLRAVTTDVER